MIENSYILLPHETMEDAGDETTQEDRRIGYEAAIKDVLACCRELLDYYSAGAAAVITELERGHHVGAAKRAVDEKAGS